MLERLENTQQVTQRYERWLTLLFGGTLTKTAGLRLFRAVLAKEKYSLIVKSTVTNLQVHDLQTKSIHLHLPYKRTCRRITLPDPYSFSRPFPMNRQKCRVPTSNQPDPPRRNLTQYLLIPTLLSQLPTQSRPVKRKKVQDLKVPMGGLVHTSSSASHL